MTREATYPFLQALDYKPGRTKDIRLLVVHATATGESSQVAETIQRTWHGDDGRIASAHLIIDNDSTVRCVHDYDTAWHAKGANLDGLGGELVGQATQTSAQWADPYSKAVITRAAKAYGEWAHRYAIPVRRLTVAQLRDGKSKGICGHADVEAAWPSTGHTDPGPHFPWDTFLALVQAEVNRLNGIPPAWFKATRTYYNGPDIDRARVLLGLPEHGGMDYAFGHALLAFRTKHGLSAVPVLDKAVAILLGP